MSSVGRAGRRGVALGTALLLVVMLAACEVAYVPSAEPSTVGPASTDEASLRNLVDVVPRGCTDRTADGVVRNRSEYPLRIVVQVGWNTLQLEQVTGEISVDVPARDEIAFEVPAPAGASAQFGCQAYAKTVGLAP